MCGFSFPQLESCNASWFTKYMLSEALSPVIVQFTDIWKHIKGPSLRPHTYTATWEDHGTLSKEF